ncbi:N-acetylmuramoyl-L-alanine amidase [Melissococcus sp. OM08-11BH]|uniref:N-acetylmuramoyl-L-alanine amidase n=1 Tax=Melissococcus sp. OM08-11BH TaxID=2293110 RepID=UPI000E544EEB|nr:N-acetylmuramoyl-L-alanine amidase [Melissococcus sp. OM08-11BH]RGI28476.1 LysM peptidoglycan-binding domain-containing protein [Melissococcus sp. OM08-11BH]
MVNVLIDYGHGGTDPGAVNGTRTEANDVLRLGKLVTQQLRENGVTVDETRQGNDTVSLENRVRQADKKVYDYFVSLHRNAAANKDATGVEAFVWKKVLSPELELATRVQKNLVNLGMKDRGVKEADFYVIRETFCPAILVEVGFISNAEDNRFFDQKINQIAHAIVTAILDQLNIKSNVSTHHTVKKGDTLYAISKQYGKTTKQLTEWNNLSDPNKIYPGQVLRVA